MYITIQDNNYCIIYLFECISVFLTSFSVVNLMSYISKRQCSDETDDEVGLNAFFTLILVRQ